MLRLKLIHVSGRGPKCYYICVEPGCGFWLSQNLVGWLQGPKYVDLSLLVDGFSSLLYVSSTIMYCRIRPWALFCIWIYSMNTSVQSCYAKAPGHQYPQCWLNILCIGPVSYKNIAHKVNSIRKWNHILKKIGTSHLRVNRTSLP